MKICRVDGCGQAVRCKELCSIHYSRMQRNGTTEKLKPRGNKRPGKDHNRFKHGMAGTSTYKSWLAMKKRCLNPDCKDYPNWGGRGITICNEWMDFNNFLRDMGEKPKGMTLERVNNDDDYKPGNCIWASRTAQSRNRRYTKMSAEQAAELKADREAGMTYPVLSEKYGISISHAHRIASGDSWRAE
ncbi:hypothetical protein [Marinobacterium sp. MBR-109]|uniref:hypothetical protein n=1 Tax=Marinobacterium sp. MBR-109 TaxID=3156462 RepID=UPI00339838B9